jgi:hypothetical protein
MDAQWKRIKAIVGEDEKMTLDVAIETFYRYLLRSLELPCEVTGMEDFHWEEGYVLWGANPKEYERLKKDRPSFRDRFDLLAIQNGVISEWMMFAGDDIGAHVKRKSDGKEFWLGLAELKCVGKKSKNTQLIGDFGVFLVNSR